MKKKFMIVVLFAVTMMTTSCVQNIGKTSAQIREKQAEEYLSNMKQKYPSIRITRQDVSHETQLQRGIDAQIRRSQEAARLMEQALMSNEEETTPSETTSAETSPDTVQTFTGVICDPLQKDGDQYYYSGEIIGYDKSLIVDDDWTTGYYTMTSGTFYTDETTKIIIETDSDYDFPAGKKSAAEWLDDFYSRKEYWMTVNIKVNGDHIEEILGIYSID